jgi:hypothetical protein
MIIGLTHGFLFLPPRMDVEEDPACPLNDLPAGLHHSFLLQVFQQLDQADLHGTIPLVCKQWAQLAAEGCRSLDVELKTEAAVLSLTSWISRSIPSFTLTGGETQFGKDSN